MEKLSSYDSASDGNVVNQVQNEYNGLGQLTKQFQAHSGAVDTGTTPKVTYAYSEMAGGANHSRLVSMTYPNGRVITYDYGTGGSLNDSISRLNAIKDGATTLEDYDYLGLGTVVRRGHPEPGVDLTYIKQGMESTGDAGDQYTGLDRFGRVTSSGNHTDDIAVLPLAQSILDHRLGRSAADEVAQRRLAVGQLGHRQEDLLRIAGSHPNASSAHRPGKPALLHDARRGGRDPFLQVGLQAGKSFLPDGNPLG